MGIFSAIGKGVKAFGKSPVARKTASAVSGGLSSLRSATSRPSMGEEKSINNGMAGLGDKLRERRRLGAGKLGFGKKTAQGPFQA